MYNIDNFLSIFTKTNTTNKYYSSFNINQSRRCLRNVFESYHKHPTSIKFHKKECVDNL